MRLFIFLTLAISLAGCGKYDRTVYVQTQIVTVPASANDAVQDIVDAENEYRLGLGQSPISQGLSCTVQLVSSGNWLSASSPGYPGSGLIVTTGTSYAYLMTGTFNQPNTSGSQPNSLLPESIRPLFLNQNYKVSCTGYIIVTESAYYDFEMTSDDGSILTVDGGPAIINNDGNHGMQAKTGVKYLRSGVRSFSLQYAQTGGGNFGLILKSGGSVVPSNVLYH